MRGLFDDHRKGTNTPRLVATITNMSEREHSAPSKWLHARYGSNGIVHRRIPCFVFDDHIAETDNCRDFILTLSNGTAFIDTQRDLVPGQTVTMLFPACNHQGPIEIMGEVIWINRKADEI